MFAGVILRGLNAAGVEGGRLKIVRHDFACASASSRRGCFGIFGATLLVSTAVAIRVLQRRMDGSERERKRERMGTRIKAKNGQFPLDGKYEIRRRTTRRCAS